MLKKVSVESAAEAYLELLPSRGVEYFFGNAGTDFAPLIEAYAKRAAQGQVLPRPLTIPHEITAVGMAHGYAMVTGRPQIVMVHVVVGTANALGAFAGAAVFELVRFYASAKLANTWQLILGLVLIAIILFAPNGLIGLWKRRRTAEGAR